MGFNLSRLRCPGPLLFADTAEDAVMKDLDPSSARDPVQHRQSTQPSGAAMAAPTTSPKSLFNCPSAHDDLNPTNDECMQPPERNPSLNTHKVWKVDGGLDQGAWVHAHPGKAKRHQPP